MCVGPITVFASVYIRNTNVKCNTVYIIMMQKCVGARAQKRNSPLSIIARREQ